MAIFSLVLLVIAWLLVGISGAIALLLVLRVAVSYATANPFAWLPYHLRRITEPMVRPFRMSFDARYSRFDLLPLVAALFVFLTGGFAAGLILRIRAVIVETYLTLTQGTPSTGFVLRESILILGLLYIIALALRILLPFCGIGYRNSFLVFIYRITEPVLKPLRRFCVIAMFDFSAVVAIIVLDLLLGLIRQNWS